jgi:hypothetical protein
VNCQNASAGTPEPVGTTWGPRYLYEYYLLPNVGGNYFKNVLKVETERINTPGKPEQFHVKSYDLALSACSRIAPDTKDPWGLFADKGSAAALATMGPSTFIFGTKTLQFMSFPSHTPDELSDMAETMLQLLGSGYPYWICCKQ